MGMLLHPHQAMGLVLRLMMIMAMVLLPHQAMVLLLCLLMIMGMVLLPHQAMVLLLLLTMIMGIVKSVRRPHMAMATCIAISIHMRITTTETTLITTATKRPAGILRIRCFL